MKKELSISEFNQAQTPRIRLAKVGAQALSNQELLTIILTTGGLSRESAEKLAKKILDKYPSLYYLRKLCLEEWQEIKGIGQGIAIRLMATIELGYRIQLSYLKVGKRVLSSKDLGKRLIAEMKDLEQEHFKVIFFNTKKYIIKEKTLFIGTLNRSTVHPREVAKEAIKVNADSIILVHNHPSGIPLPSKEDIKLTNQIAKGAYLIGVKVSDHLIIGNRSYHSMLAHRQIKIFKTDSYTA